MITRHGFPTSASTILVALLVSIVILVGCATEGRPRILSHYGSMTGVLGGPRGERHTGVDFDGSRGDPVLAAADGEVVRVFAGCVALQHEISGTRWRTRYCHLDETDVASGQRVARGELLGKVGTTGRSMGVPHLHFELCEGEPCQRVDPLAFIAGCFEPAESVAHPAFEASGGKPRPVLTYPLRCAIRKSLGPTQ